MLEDIADEADIVRLAEAYAVIIDAYATQPPEFLRAVWNEFVESYLLPEYLEAAAYRETCQRCWQSDARRHWIEQRIVEKIKLIE